VPGVAGWCLTELTDVPHEFNGLLDLPGRPKQPAIAEIRRAAQQVCPILVRRHWAARTGSTLEGELVVVNDGPAVKDAELVVELGTTQHREHVSLLPGHAVTAVSAVTLPCTAPPGAATLTVTLRKNDLVLGSNTYPIRVVHIATPGTAVTALPHDDGVRNLLRTAAAAPTDPAGAKPQRHLLVIGEGALDAEAAEFATDWLRRAGHVLLLAQHDPGMVRLPLPARLSSLDTAWGSTSFIFTTEEPALASLPRRAVLASELLSTAPEYVYTDIAGGPFASETAVAVLKPPPARLLGTVIGRMPAEAGQLTVCQLPLADAAQGGDPLAIALIGDLLRWASRR